VTIGLGWVILFAFGVVLIAGALRTAQRPSSPVADTAAEQAAIWQRLHHAPDVDPYANPLQRAFMKVTYFLATPLARRGVKPDVLTMVGLWVAALTALLAWQGGRWPIAAGLILVASSFLDGVDGAVAGLTDRSSLRGSILDSVVDRIAEALFVAAIVLAGARALFGVWAFGAIILHEYTRSRWVYAALQSGRSEVGLITVGERPTRVIGCSIALVAMGFAPQHRHFVGNWSLIIVAVVTVVGWLQLVRFIAKHLD
jgi:archaetidylinositol phosphate synthase